jgi:hypothetical protein
VTFRAIEEGIWDFPDFSAGLIKTALRLVDAIDTVV